MTVGVSFYYVYLIASIFDVWDNTAETYIQKPIMNYMSFSVIIAARNEEENITQVLQSIFSLHYPDASYEVIVVDDHSDDRTVELAKIFGRAIVISNKGLGKKSAIETGVSKASNDYVISIDADCIVHQDLLSLYNSKIQTDKDLQFIAGAVIVNEEQSVLGYFQSLDMMSLMAATVYGLQENKYFLANGANMCFSRSAFFVVNGFSGNEQIPSGDDIFLINKIKEIYGCQAIGFLKSRRGAVKTKPKIEIGNFIQQRIRWASKTKRYANRALLRLQGTVFGTHAIATALLLCSIWIPIAIFCFILLIFIKGVIDYLFLSKLASFFEEKWALKGFILASILYYPYILLTAISALTQKGYLWKGRSIKT